MPKQKVAEKILKSLKHKKIGKADIHIHSNFSDGAPGITEILDYIEDKTDLDVVAITDHDTIEGALLAKDLVESSKYRFDFIVGEEVTSKSGHILGLFLTEKVEPGQTTEDTIKAIKKQGGIAIASHPFQHTNFKDDTHATMDGIGAKELLKNKNNLDGVEVVNATPTLDSENLSASILNRTVLFLAETGSSDAHILDAIGKGYTTFEGDSAEEFKKAILTDQTIAIHDKWTFSALMKYLFFFIPVGFRLALHTIVYRIKHGRKK